MTVLSNRCENKVVVAHGVGRCRVCGTWWEPGDLIRRSIGSGWGHDECIKAKLVAMGRAPE
jgi:hypothetical protein